MRAVTVALLIALACPAIAGEPPRVEFLRPVPHYTNTDAGVELKVRVDPRPEHRLLIMMAIDRGGEVVRRSDEDLPGADAPRTRWVRWRSLPAGALVIWAEVWDGQKVLGRAQTPLCVMAPLENPCSIGPDF